MTTSSTLFLELRSWKQTFPALANPPPSPDHFCSAFHLLKRSTSFWNMRRHSGKTELDVMITSRDNNSKRQVLTEDFSALKANGHKPSEVLQRFRAQILPCWQDALMQAKSGSESSSSQVIKNHFCLSCEHLPVFANNCQLYFEVDWIRSAVYSIATLLYSAWWDALWWGWHCWTSTCMLYT